MVEDIQPVGEDFSKSIEDLAEHAGEVALEIYRAELDQGSKQTYAFSKAIDAAKNVMMDSGCPLDICDLLADAAIMVTNHLLRKTLMEIQWRPLMLQENLLMMQWNQNLHLPNIYFINKNKCTR